jgi:hypothetical protein
MSRLMQCVILIGAVMGSCAATAATAGAITWENSGDTHFTASGGSGTLTLTATPFQCPGSSITGKTTTPLTWISAPVLHATVTFSGCSLSGQSVGYECAYTFTSVSQSGSVTSGAIDATCGMWLAGIKVCHVEGSTGASYANPVPPSTFARVQTVTGGALRITNGQSNCMFGNNELAHLSVLTFTVSGGAGGSTPHLGPIITRTA